MRKTFFIVLAIAIGFLFSFGIAFGEEGRSDSLLRYCGVPSVAFWIWTPKSHKLLNPKHAPKDTPQQQFDYAMEFFKAGDYKRASEEFINMTTYFKDSHLAPEAQYYLGRSYEAAGKYYPAYQAYQKTVSTYPFTKRIDEIIEREYLLGKILYKKHSGKLMGKEIMTDLDRAVEIFKSVRDNSPFGKYADKAQFMIGKCYKKSEEYRQASKAFQKVIDEYPKSALLEEASYEIAECTYLASRRADYDQELTDKAIKEFKKVAKEGKGDFGVSEKAAKTISTLEERKAESFFKTARFYERQKRYKSAAIYYQEILQKYPRSSFADAAKAGLEGVSRFVKE